MTSGGTLPMMNQENNGVSRATVDNVRRTLSSFFRWLEDEEPTSQIDTTMQYAMVKQSNVKISHKRYIG
jgi:site-specific recombinase XerD